MEKKIYLQLFKLLELQYKIAFQATDEEEERFIASHFGKPALIYTAGNFPNNIGGLPMPPKEPGMLRLISIALISPMKNILLVLEALGKAGALIQYDIYGPVKDAEYWDQCKAKMSSLPANISVKYHEEIEPAKVKGALEQGHVYILPSKSENFGHAIYEALSAGRPVITSNYTPWNNLRESRAGINVAIENTAGLEEAINFFAAMDAAELGQWSHGAVTYATERYRFGKNTTTIQGDVLRRVEVGAGHCVLVTSLRGACMMIIA